MTDDPMDDRQFREQMMATGLVTSLSLARLDPVLVDATPPTIEVPGVGALEGRTYRFTITEVDS